MAISRYFHIKIVGQETYWTGRKNFPWGSWSQGKLFNKNAILAWLRYWKYVDLPLHKSGAVSIKSLQFIEYDLIEKREFNIEEFHDRFSKTPIIKL
jgi:hypothetical protein